MTIYRKYGRYRATFAPRDTGAFEVKPEVKPYIGRRLLVRYQGLIGVGEGRDSYAGEHEFVIDLSEVIDDDIPIWFSKEDLSGIEEVAV